MKAMRHFRTGYMALVLALLSHPGTGQSFGDDRRSIDVQLNRSEVQRPQRWQAAQILRRLIQQRRGASEAVPENYAGTPGKYKVGYTVLHTTAPARTGGDANIAIAVWYPTDEETQITEYETGDNRLVTRLARDGAPLAGPFPLVLYSHGATGSGLNMSFGTERLAAEGFIVAAPDYTDKYYAARITGPVHLTMQETRTMLKWLDELREYDLNRGGVKYRHEQLMYRPKQARAALDKVLSENSLEGSLLKGRIATDKIGIVGHSFGAWTSLLLAGADPLAADPRVRAVAALSGPVNNSVFEPNEIGRIKVPVLFMYGGEEPKVGRMSDKMLLYDRANSPKYLVGVTGADHFTFSGGVSPDYATVAGYLVRDKRRATIVGYVEAFMKYYLLGDQAAGERLKRRGAEVMDYASE